MTGMSVLSVVEIIFYLLCLIADFLLPAWSLVVVGNERKSVTTMMVFGNLEKPRSNSYEGI